MRSLFVAIRCGKQTSPTLRLWAGVGINLSNILDDYSRYTKILKHDAI